MILTPRREDFLLAASSLYYLRYCHLPANGIKLGLYLFLCIFTPSAKDGMTDCLKRLIYEF
jgi:hypothetical protein